jgi:diaminohydroxyphosphoribosylaminopyrimidine deaminase/5-amino-6-(5-phosphoribosylamino)uracil reductase
VLTRSGELPRHAHLFSDRLAARTLIYKAKSLAGVLKHLGKRGITSVLIEGGGDVLGQALDARLIDKVQLYLGPIFTGGPVIAFPGRGVENTANALRLCSVSYQRIGQSVCIIGYPERLRSE